MTCAFKIIKVQNKITGTVKKLFLLHAPVLTNIYVMIPSFQVLFEGDPTHPWRVYKIMGLLMEEKNIQRCMLLLSHNAESIFIIFEFEYLHKFAKQKSKSV